MGSLNADEKMALKGMLKAELEARLCKNGICLQRVPRASMP